MSPLKTPLALWIAGTSGFLSRGSLIALGNEGAPGTRVPSLRNWRWQLLQFPSESATPRFVGTHRRK
jgi:hypothetical protein